jgi:hypothetical protein
MPALAEQGYRCVAIDLPGFNGNPSLPLHNCPLPESVFARRCTPLAHHPHPTCSQPPFYSLHARPRLTQIARVLRNCVGMATRIRLIRCAAYWTTWALATPCSWGMTGAVRWCGRWRSGTRSECEVWDPS